MDYRKICRNCLDPAHPNRARGQLQADNEHEIMAYNMKKNTRRYW